MFRKEKVYASRRVWEALVNHGAPLILAKYLQYLQVKTLEYSHFRYQHHAGSNDALLRTDVTVRKSASASNAHFSTSSMSFQKVCKR